jgi:hypothetical protein
MILAENLQNSPKFVSLRPENNSFWTYVLDFALTDQNLWDKVKKSIKLYSGKKSAKKDRPTSSQRGLVLVRWTIFLLVILLGLAAQIKIFGEAPPKSKAS